MSGAPVSFMSIIIIAAVIAIALAVIVVSRSGKSHTPTDRPSSQDFDAQINQLKGESEADAEEKQEEETPADISEQSDGEDGAADDKNP